MQTIKQSKLPKRVANKKMFLFLGMVIFTLILVIISFNPDLLVPNIKVNIALHSSIEAFGALASIIFGLLIYSLKYRKEPLDFYWFSIALFVMGILDFFHALSPIANNFVLFHSGSVFFGGLLSSLILFQKNYFSDRLKSITLAAILIFIGAISISHVLYPQLGLKMLSDGEFTNIAKTLNVTGGGLFFLSAVFFFVKYYKSTWGYYYYYGVFLFLLGLGGVTFLHDAIWTEGWWFWHAIRFAAFIMAIIIVLFDYKILNSKLRESEKKHRYLIDNQGEGLGIANLNEEFIFVNPAAEKIFGLETGQLVGRNLNEFIDKSQLKILEEQSAIRQQKKKSSFELTITRFNKQKVNILVTATPELDDQDEVIGTLGIFRDITDRINAQQALSKSEEKQKVILDTFEEGIYINSPDYRIEYANSALHKKIGRNPIGEVCHKALYNIDEKCSWCIYEKLGDEEKIIEYELNTDHQKTLVVHNVLLKNKSKLTVFRDITERKKVDQALKESEKKYKHLIKNARTAIIKLDEKGFITFFNEYATELFGYTEAEVIGSHIIGIIVPNVDSNQMNLTKMVELFTSGTGKHYDIAQENENITKSGERIWMSWSNKAVVDAKGNIIEIISVGIDISERKIAEEAIKKSETKLRESNDTKDKFFSIIAHDLKSPFSTMLGFSDLLIAKFDKYDEQKQRKFLGIINQDLKNTYKLLENLLLWSHTQRGTIDYHPEKVNLYLLAVETLSLLNQTFVNKSITFTNQIPEDVFVQADEHMILTIFRNLISNAIKFTPKDGVIEIGFKKRHGVSQYKKTGSENSVDEPVELVELYVKDSGVGIPMEKQALLFKITKNISTKGTEGETGTGLGLILCKEFIEMHGGEIWVESEIAKGSKFIFTLPFS